MDSLERKLPKDARPSLMACPADTVAPFVPVLAPAYTYMERNEKFLLVKEPLDFFSPEELARWKASGNLYFLRESAAGARFRQAARVVQPILTARLSAAAIQARLLEPASYEVSDAILRLLAPLWGRAPTATACTIDQFGVAIFVQELCGPLPPETLRPVRELDIALCLRAQLSAAWSVFLGLHLGYCNLPFLKGLRARAFQSAIQASAVGSETGEVAELIDVAQATLAEPLPSLAGGAVSAERLSQDFGRTSEKIAARLNRVERLADV